MLRSARRWAGVASMTLSAATLGAGIAQADGGVDCPPNVVICTVDAGGGGTPGGGGGGGTSGGGGGGGTEVCEHSGQQITCSDPKWGWFNPSDQCYWALMNPQPPDSDPVWTYATGAPKVHKPGDGALYNVTCPFPGWELMGGTSFSPTPPPGFGGAVDPAVLAQRMVTQMGLLGADIGTAPRKNGTSLVGLPVWLWNNASDSTWGPKTASASAAGVTVTATAHVDRIIWSTGDGASVTCNGPGKAYDPAYGTQQPDCGHTYSQPGKYTITATSKWVVDWKASTGQGGQILVDRTSNATVSIAEAQALNTQ